MRYFRVVLIMSALAFSQLLGGCAYWHYETTEVGNLQGRLIVEWYEPDLFRFIPDEEDPLIFVRSNQDAIQPAAMNTDGGSIPRPLWVLKSYSPWGYAPAYIVHDWLFEMKHCELPGHERYSLKDSATVMSEIMKTMMEDPRYGGRNELVLYSMYVAVTSPIAGDLWENGECTADKPMIRLAPDAQPTARYPIAF